MDNPFGLFFPQHVDDQPTYLERLGSNPFFRFGAALTAASAPANGTSLVGNLSLALANAADAARRSRRALAEGEQVRRRRRESAGDRRLKEQIADYEYYRRGLPRGEKPVPFAQFVAEWGSGEADFMWTPEKGLYR